MADVNEKKEEWKTKEVELDNIMPNTNGKKCFNSTHSTSSFLFLSLMIIFSFISFHCYLPHSGNNGRFIQQFSGKKCNIQTSTRKMFLLFFFLPLLLLFHKWGLCVCVIKFNLLNLLKAYKTAYAVKEESVKKKMF